MHKCRHTHTRKNTLCSDTLRAAFTGGLSSSRPINLSLWGGSGAALGLSHVACTDTSFSLSFGSFFFLLTPHKSLADVVLSGKRVIGLGRLGLKFWPPSNNRNCTASLEFGLWKRLCGIQSEGFQLCVHQALRSFSSSQRPTAVLSVDPVITWCSGPPLRKTWYDYNMINGHL